MKIINNILLIFGLLIVATACYEEPEARLDQLIKDKLGSVPVVSNIAIINSQFPGINDVPGGKIDFEVQYFSDAPIKQISYYEQKGYYGKIDKTVKFFGGEIVLIESKPYESAFSERYQLDTIVFSYDIPANALGKVVRLIVEIEGEDGIKSVDDIDTNIYQNMPTIRIDSIATDSLFMDNLYPGEYFEFFLKLNEDATVLYRERTRVEVFEKIGGGVEKLISTIPASEQEEPSLSVMLPLSGAGEAVTYRFVAISTFTDTDSDDEDNVIDFGSSETDTTLNLDIPIPLTLLSDQSITLNETDTIGYDLVNLVTVATAGSDNLKDLVISESNQSTGSAVLESLNGTQFIKIDESDDFDQANLNYLISTFNGKSSSVSVTAAIGDTFIAYLRPAADAEITETSDMVIFTITSIGRSASGAVSVMFDVKY